MRWLMTIGPAAIVSSTRKSTSEAVSIQVFRRWMTPSCPLAGGVVSDIRYTQSSERNGRTLVMSREDQAAQKSVTSLTLARSASFQSAADADRDHPENAANAAPPEVPADVRKVRLFITGKYNHSTVRSGHRQRSRACAQSCGRFADC